MEALQNQTLRKIETSYSFSYTCIMTYQPKLVELPHGFYVDVKTCLAYDVSGKFAGPAMRSGDKWYVVM